MQRKINRIIYTFTGILLVLLLMSWWQGKGERKRNSVRQLAYAKKQDSLETTLNAYKQILEAQLLKAEGRAEFTNLISILENSADPLVNRALFMMDSVQYHKIVEVKIPVGRRVDTVFIDTLKDVYEHHIKTLLQQLEDSRQALEILNVQLEATSRDTDVLELKSAKGASLTYVGKVKNGKANGFGVALYESGSTYEGEWKNDMRDGYGKFRWSDGEWYEGNYKEDKREGFGVYTWKNGERYEGAWVHDSRNGHGRVLKKSGELKKEGNWIDDDFQLDSHK